MINRSGCFGERCAEPDPAGVAALGGSTTAALRLAARQVVDSSDRRVEVDLFILRADHGVVHGTSSAWLGRPGSETVTPIVLFDSSSSAISSVGSTVTVKPCVWL
jgi:hypothetical protein